MSTTNTDAMKHLKAITSGTAIALAVALCIPSCQGGTKSSEEDVKTEESVLSQHTDSLHVSNISNEHIQIVYDFHFLKPGTAVSDSVNAGIDQVFLTHMRRIDIPQAIVDAMAKEEAELKEILQESYDPDDETFGQMKLSALQSGRFMYDAQDTVIAYQGVSDVYLGGAHGSYSPFYLNFSKYSGHIIRIENLFDTAKESEILNVIQKQLLKDKGCSTREELMEKTSLLAFGELYLTPNFHLGKDSITFCFGQYEIGPYSSGITYITLDYDALAPYMRK